MLTASVPQYKIISFDVDGNILKIAKSNMEGKDFIKVHLDELKDISNGTYSMFDYCVEYDFLEKNYKFKHRKKLEEEKTVTNFLHRISDDIIDADIKIIKDNVKNKWRLSVNKSLEKNLKEKNIKIDPTIGFYSITKKDNPNVLYKVLQFSESLEIAFTSIFEFDNNEFSIYTLKKFDTYCYEEINE